MSVLSCARRGCPNIMCDRLSHEHGYICDECYEELVNSGPTTDIAEFMEDSRPAYNKKAQAEARYNAEFILRSEDF